MRVDERCFRDRFARAAGCKLSVLDVPSLLGVEAAFDDVLADLGEEVLDGLDVFEGGGFSGKLAVLHVAFEPLGVERGHSAVFLQVGLGADHHDEHFLLLVAQVFCPLA